MNSARQRGIAIITVLLVLALAVIIAAEMTQRLGFQIRRVEHQVGQQQGFWLAMSGEALAKSVLRQTFKDEPNLVHLGQMWATQGAVYPVEQGEIAGKISDLQGCFNLNATAGDDPSKTAEARPQQTLILKAILEGVGVESYQAELIAEATRDWVDADTELGSSMGAEDSEYESLTYPYLAANSLMADVSEFRAIRGVSSQVYRLAAPMLCALPDSAALKVNVNTIPADHAALLYGLLTPHITLDQAADLLAARPQNGFESLDDFWAQPEVAVAAEQLSKVRKEMLTVKSDYFKVEVEARLDRVRFRMESALMRQGERLNVLRRQFGGSQ